MLEFIMLFIDYCLGRISLENKYTHTCSIDIMCDRGRRKAFQGIKAQILNDVHRKKPCKHFKRGSEFIDQADMLDNEKKVILEYVVEVCGFLKGLAIITFDQLSEDKIVCTAYCSESCYTALEGSEDWRIKVDVNYTGKRVKNYFLLNNGLQWPVKIMKSSPRLKILRGNSTIIV